MIDRDGYRLNVGIILANQAGDVLWARRYGESSWQFPQGGIDKNESAETAMYRELEEEIGLSASDVKILGKTKGWLKYALPSRLLRRRKNVFKGQKQKWFLLKLLSNDEAVKLDSSKNQEFDCWRWVTYWFPLNEIVHFKKDVYRKALLQLSPKLSKLKSDY
ncbi:MAG: RNA pyrophosphohydrolase [Gammaproteobacteria bacterium]|nr:RNA pyrophosphohydrolase [Gammaproteobacteria bacterium]